MVPFCPVPFCPTMPFCPNIPGSILPQSLRLGKSHYVNYNIARCSIKLCKNANKKYIIIFNQMQRFYYLIYQSIWCQKRVNWLIKRVKFRFCEILKTWSIASLISMHDAELADDRNQVDLKIDPRLAWFFQNTRCSILPPCSILPRLTMYMLLHMVCVVAMGDIIDLH